MAVNNDETLVNLSPEEELQIKNAWSLFDADGSGSIDSGELRDVLKK